MSSYPCSYHLEDLVAIDGPDGHDSGKPRALGMHHLFYPFAVIVIGKIAALAASAAEKLGLVKP